LAKFIQITARSCDRFAQPGVIGPKKQPAIVARAFELWLARGFRDGSPQEDWLRAWREAQDAARPIPLPGQTPARLAWAELVDRIRENDAQAIVELYRVFSRGVRFYLCRQLGPQGLDDRVHDTLLSVAKAIQQGALRKPERLLGFVRTVVRRQVAAPMADEQDAIRRENQETALKALKRIGPRDREILIRFHLLKEPAQKIGSEMGLTETQFQLLKMRATARVGQCGKRVRLSAASLRKAWVRDG